MHAISTLASEQTDVCNYLADLPLSLCTNIELVKQLPFEILHRQTTCKNDFQYFTGKQTGTICKRYIMSSNIIRLSIVNDYESMFTFHEIKYTDFKLLI